MTLILLQTMIQSISSTLYWIGFYAGIRALPGEEWRRRRWAIGSAMIFPAWPGRGPAACRERRLSPRRCEDTAGADDDACGRMPGAALSGLPGNHRRHPAAL